MIILKSISFVFPVYYNDKEFTTIAFLECDEHNEYKCILAHNDISADFLNEGKIYCRYFFDYRGNLSTNLINIRVSDHSGERALLDRVKAYYALPESERWGWI